MEAAIKTMLKPIKRIRFTAGTESFRPNVSMFLVFPFGAPSGEFSSPLCRMSFCVVCCEENLLHSFSISGAVAFWRANASLPSNRSRQACKHFVSFSNFRNSSSVKFSGCFLLLPMLGLSFPQNIYLLSWTCYSLYGMYVLTSFSGTSLLFFFISNSSRISRSAFIICFFTPLVLMPNSSATS